MSSPKALSPTPPLFPESGFDVDHQSPSATSSRSSISAAQHPMSTMNSTEPYKQRQLQAQASESYSVPQQSSHSPYLNSPYGTSPSIISNYPYNPQSHLSGTTPGMYYQRALPVTFSSQDLPASMTPSISSSHNTSPVDHSNPWQHHHYIAPSASAALAGQTQDRYICQTCSKAFSRPSSLRIHSHSHTGEKPFKCPRAGCGKAFSVRSNMKRHERGCHGADGSPESP